MADNRPVGVFDSGMGGLTVLAELASSLPSEKFIYLGDTARIPYGSRSPRTIRRYSREIAHFLSQFDIKLLVVACNTASAHAMDDLKQMLPVPVIGVIEPGVKALLGRTKSNNVGVIGTRSTIKSAAYEQEIHRNNATMRVHSQACPLLVPIVEEGWVEKEFARLAVREYLQPLSDKGVDAIVLGCTHYPLLKSAISAEFPAIQLVDSSIETAAELKNILSQSNSLSDGKGSVRILVTDVTEQVQGLQSLFFPHHPLESVEEVIVPELKS